MLAHHISSFAMELQYLFVGLAVAVVLQHLLVGRRSHAGSVALWSTVSSASLACALAANLWVFMAPEGQFNLAMFVRDLLLVVAVIVQLPTIAAFAGKPWPRRGVAVLGAFGLVRLVLWLSTDLVYAHRTGPNGCPVYGPLLLVLTGPQLLVCVGLVVKLARGWKDRFERWVLLAGFGLGLGVVMASLFTGETPIAELLTGYWIIPWVAALQVLFARRVRILEAVSRSHARDVATALAVLARTERRSRLALQSGAMGWFEYDPDTGELEASPELRAMLGLGPTRSGLTTDSALGYFFPRRSSPPPKGSRNDRGERCRHRGSPLEAPRRNDALGGDERPPDRPRGRQARSRRGDEGHHRTQESRTQSSLTRPTPTRSPGFITERASLPRRARLSAGLSGSACCL